jgi:integrase/recombinase XerD
VKDNPYIFNLLDSSVKENDPRALDKAISRATAIYNKQLKNLAVKAGITKSLSSHVSRHSFATRALRRGISLDKVQYILQHHSPAVTQIYAKLANEEVDKAMDLMN